MDIVTGADRGFLSPSRLIDIGTGADCGLLPPSCLIDIDTQVRIRRFCSRQVARELEMISQTRSAGKDQPEKISR